MELFVASTHLIRSCGQLRIVAASANSISLSKDDASKIYNSSEYQELL
jgi:hypothetical protein